jgi:hypothetical protein
MARSIDRDRRGHKAKGSRTADNLTTPSGAACHRVKLAPTTSREINPLPAARPLLSCPAMSIRVALHYANRTFHLLALGAIAALAVVTAFAVSGDRDDGDTDLRRVGDSLQRSALSLEANRPLRASLGPEIAGNATDDYRWRCDHRHPRELPTAARLAALDASERAALEIAAIDPIEQAIIDRFARGQFREDVGSGPTSVACLLGLLRRPRAVLTAALLAADNGDLDLAWSRAISVVRHADDVLGRDSLLILAAASGSATVAVAVMADLAELGSSEQVERWRDDVAALRASALDPEQLDVAIATGAGLALLAFESEVGFDRDWHRTWKRDLEMLEQTAAGADPDIAVRCEKVGEPGLCEMRENVRRDVTVVAAGLESVDCMLARGTDLRCEAAASRL